jgi:hypothetical protein
MCKQAGRERVSGRWGCRPLVGMGVMEVHGFEVLTPNLLTECLPGAAASIGRSIQFVPVRTYPALEFDDCSPTRNTR